MEEQDASVCEVVWIPLTWWRQLGREVKLCTWVSPNRQLRKQWRAAWYSPCCWSCCPSSNRPSLPPFSIPSPKHSHRLPSALPQCPTTNTPLHHFTSSTTGRATQEGRFKNTSPNTKAARRGVSGRFLSSCLCSEEVKDRWWGAGWESFGKYTAKIHSLPPPRLHQERRTEEVTESGLCEWQSSGPITALHRQCRPAHLYVAHGVFHPLKGKLQRFVNDALNIASEAIWVWFPYSNFHSEIQIYSEFTAYLLSRLIIYKWAKHKEYAPVSQAVNAVWACSTINQVLCKSGFQHTSRQHACVEDRSHWLNKYLFTRSVPWMFAHFASHSDNQH